MKKFLKGSEGFTLVELMVVVAIIGILSAVAIPNFKKYQAKSKQSEAKIQLAALYTAEVSAQADYNTYASCINDLGYETPAKGYYWIGFSDAAAQNAIVVAAPYNAVCASASGVRPAALMKAQGVDAVIGNLPTAGSTAVTTTTFTAGAVGQISANNPAFDRWIINEAKNLTQSGVPGI